MADVFSKHYRVKELAAIWGMSSDTITRLFSNEPGVLQVNNFGNGKRKYTLLSIPESVALRVHESLSHNPLQVHPAEKTTLRVIRLGDLPTKRVKLAA